jgi:WD40 repeat protein
MLRFILCPFLLALAVGDVSAQPPRVLRKPLAEYVAAKSEGPENAIVRADLSPDGKLVACFRRGGKLTVYAVGEANPLFTTEGATERERANNRGMATFSADGKLIAFPGKAGKRIEILSARTGKPHATAELPRPDAVDALAFSPDGRKLAVSSGFLYHKDLYIFDTATGKLLGQPLRDVDGAALQLIFSPDGKRLVANHYSTIYVVDTVAHRLIKELTVTEPFAFAVFFQGEKLLAAQGESLAIHEVTDEGFEKEVVGRFAEKLETVSAYRTAISGQPPVAAIALKNEVSVRDMKGRELFRVAGEDSPIQVRLSADGRVLLIYWWDSLRVQVFRLE